MKINLKVNGTDYSFEVSEFETLLELLRDRLGLLGVKEGCGKGECGACTVVMNGKAITSCIVLASHAHNSEIITIEGLSKNGKLHPIQEAFVDEGAVQCGFCTPGMVMSSYALLMKNNNPSEDEIKTALEGNLCRCTGYQKIISAVKEAAKRLRNV
jgi:carbon-monoxide dehydrogenase small subunit